MKVPSYEVVANRIGPESCGFNGNGVAEELTWESADGPLRSKITAIWVPTLLLGGEGNIVHSDGKKDQNRKNSPNMRPGKSIFFIYMV